MTQLTAIFSSSLLPMVNQNSFLAGGCKFHFPQLFLFCWSGDTSHWLLVFLRHLAEIEIHLLFVVAECVLSIVLVGAYPDRCHI